MPIEKKPIDPERIRTLPPGGFSWIDRRFLGNGHLEALPTQTALVYFFLVAVSDREGLSYYSDPKVCGLLKINAEELTQARARLLERGLLLYCYPIYQVLPVPPRIALQRDRRPPTEPAPRTSSKTKPEHIRQLVDAYFARIQGENDPHRS